jgi:hypothetical protein
MLHTVLLLAVFTAGVFKLQCNFPYQASIFGVSKPMAAMDASSQTAISLQNEAAIRFVRHCFTAHPFKSVH